MTAVQIDEVSYVDARAGHDKFYRTFVIGQAWLTQYGRSGTLGTFTKIVETADHDAAVKAAASKIRSKVKKGYVPKRSGTVEGIADLSDVTVLDDAAHQLPIGDNPTSVDMGAAPTVDLAGAEVRPNRVAEVVAVLAWRPSAAAVPTDLTPELPVRPMLASVQDEQSVAAAMTSDQWFGQFKYDGDRVVIEVVDGQIRVLNRQGQAKVRNVGHAHLAPFTALHSGRWVFDGEVVGRTLVLFDIAAATDGTRTWVRDDTGFVDRYLVLASIAGVLSIPSAAERPDGSVVLAPTADDTDSKADFLATAVAEHREGIVLRHRDGGYEQARRSTTLVKHKLVKDADVVVVGLNPSKESADLAVYDGGVLTQVGSASTIGKDAVAGPGGVQVGQVWKVLFLYVNDPAHPRMVQPRLIERRTDKASDECDLAQFADAGTSKVV